MPTRSREARRIEKAVSLVVTQDRFETVKVKVA
jgi:hypothetical protein